MVTIDRKSHLLYLFIETTAILNDLLLNIMANLL